MSEVAERFLKTIEKELNIYINDIDLDSVDKAAEIILEAEKKGNRVHITGIGKPAHVAGYISSLFSSVGIPSYLLDGTEAIHGSSGQVVRGDVVIAISNSGETEELKKTVSTLIDNGAIVICCSGNPNSSIANLSKLTLLAHVNEEGDTLNRPPRASILAEIIILQTLSDVLQEMKKLNISQYVKWHPGGLLGKSIIHEKGEIENG